MRLQVSSQVACLKYFNKCCSKLARTFREMSGSSVQTIHKIFWKSIRILACNDSGNLYATFLVIFREIFLQGCGNIGSKIFCPGSEYFEKLCRKVSARCVIFQVSLVEAFVKYFNKCCSELARTYRKMLASSVQTIQKIFQKSFRNLPCNDSGNPYKIFLVIFREIFLQGCGNIG